MIEPIPAPHPTTEVPQEPTLSALLRGIARRSSDAQAAVACGKGILGTAGIMIFAPHWWRLALAFLAIACFGLWIVLERSDASPRWRRLAQGAAVVVGAGSVFALGLSLLMLALGRWIS